MRQEAAVDGPTAFCVHGVSDTPCESMLDHPTYGAATATVRAPQVPPTPSPVRALAGGVVLVQLHPGRQPSNHIADAPVDPACSAIRRSADIRETTGRWASNLGWRRSPKLHGMKMVKACIGLAVPGRPIGPWSRRTGAPEASATGRDRNPRCSRDCSRDGPRPPGTSGYRMGRRCGVRPAPRPGRNQERTSQHTAWAI